MKTLVLKCDEVVNNPNLRRMNELRFSVQSRGDGSSPLNILLNNDNVDLSVPTKVKVLNGTAKVGLTSNISSASTEVTLIKTNSLYVFAPSGSSEISIVDFDLEENVSKFTYTLASSTNSPYPWMAPQDVPNVPSLHTYISDNANGMNVLDGVETITVGDNDNDTDFVIGFHDVVSKLPNVRSINVVRCKFTGGDFYELFSDRSGVSGNLDYIFARTSSYSAAHDNPVYSCSYVSGASIKPFTFKNFSMFRSGTITNKAVCVALLNMFIDGINANKITVATDATLKLTCDSWRNDLDIQALVTTLGGLGITVTLYNA